MVATSLLAAAAGASTPAEDAERASLGRERAAIDTLYTTRVDECHQHFVVTSCVEDAKRDRRRGLDALRSRQIVLDEKLRKERSEQRRSELAVNAAEAARRDAARASRPAAAGSEAAGEHDKTARAIEPRRPTGEHAPTPKHRGAGAAAGKPAAPASGTGDRAAKEARSRATFEARKQHATEHREEVVGKTIERTKQRPAAAPLPLPGGGKPAP